MEIQQRFASAIQAYKIMSGYTCAECAAALDVSLTALKQYAAGKGNPGIETPLNMFPQKWGSILLAGAFSDAQLAVLKTFFDSMRLFDTLSPDKKIALLSHLIAILSLFADRRQEETNA